MTKKDFELTRQFRDDLMAAYRQVCGKCWTQREAWQKTAESPAPRYYVSAKEAHEKLRRMVVGDTSIVDAMSERRRRMYYSLFAKLQILSQKKEMIGKSLWFMCPFLVTQPAPEFFVSADTVKEIFRNYKLYGNDYRILEIRRKRADRNKKKNNTDNGCSSMPDNI